MKYLFGLLFMAAGVHILVQQIHITRLEATIRSHSRHLESVMRTLGIANNAYVCYTKSSKVQLEAMLGN